MLFTSYGFLGFLAVLFLLYYIIPRKCQWGLLLGAGEGRESVQAEEPVRQEIRSEAGMRPDAGRGPL